MRAKDLDRYRRRAELERLSASKSGATHEHDSHASHGPAASLREAEYRGHRISITTTYDVAIDGKRISLPFHVDDNGVVSCHAVPNYASTSALDVGRRIIDAYPHRYRPRAPARSRRRG